MATIAIDYDKTYTVDPILWDIFAVHAQQRGHTVICVTCRAFNPDPKKGELMPLIQIYMTANEQKRTYMDKLGIKVDIWIDDMPETIGQVHLIGQ